MAQLPFHYYLALREDWVNVHSAKPDDEEDRSATDAEVIEFNAETFLGESV